MHVIRLATVMAIVCVTSGTVMAQTKVPSNSIPEGQMHIVGAAKLIVNDAQVSQQYFERYFGMHKVTDFNVAGAYVEPIMGYEEGASLALFQPLKEVPLKKPAAPVALIYTPDFEQLVKGLEAAKQPVTRMPSGSSGMTIAIARDPSGNAVEIFSRPGKVAVGGSKLIVDDRAKAEAFIAKVFGIQAGRRFVTAGYDEVLMMFGEGPFLALFQPKNEAPLPKSQHPVVAIYTRDFDNVVQRVKEEGYGYRELPTGSSQTRIIIAKDPAGNSIEIIQRGN